jgi:hypothetical protein
MGYYAAQEVPLPQPCKPRRGRWITSLIACFVGALIMGIVLGSASTADGSNAECAQLADEYAALVSEGLDAGLSGDEARMLDVAERRDTLGEQVKNFC